MPNNSVYTKLYLTIEEQVRLLESRGLVVSDREKAERYLSKIGYYRLSGYSYVFRRSEQNSQGRMQVFDEFKENVSFDNILDLYVFDKQLRFMLLDAIERIEIALRVDVALHIGKYDSKAHLDNKFHHEAFSITRNGRALSGFNEWQNKFSKSFNNSREDFVEHFKHKYQDCQLPIWMAVELWDFGMLSIYIDNLKDAYKAPIASQYGLNTYKLLGSWLHTINIVRNICAHHGRLWNRVLTAQPQYPRVAEASLLRPMVENQMPANRLFAAMCIIQYFMRYISPNSQWHERMKGLMDNFPDSKHISPQIMGAVDHWQDWSLWE